MKIIRIWLLVLLAVLLPVRGVIAAAMLCPPAKGGGQLAAAAHLPGTSHHNMMDAAGHEEHAHAHHQHAAHDPGTPSSGHHADGFGKCNLCCEFCSATPLLSTPPIIPASLNFSSISFPDLAAPHPSFLSEGQERPPRSI